MPLRRKAFTVPGIEIYLLDVWKEHVDAINANGILMEEQGDFITYRNVKASTVAEDAGTCDLAVIFVKSLTSSAVQSNKATDRNHRSYTAEWFGEH